MPLVPGVFYKANQKYNATLSSDFTVSDTTLGVSAIPSNTPTIVTVARGTDKETRFIATGTGVNQLTGVSRLDGANVNIPAGSSVECVNDADFVNQLSGAVFSQLALKSLIYAADGGSNDTYAIALPVTPAAYTDLIGVPIAFKANTANTGPATLNVNSLGAKDIKKNVSEDLETGDILEDQVVIVVYDGTNFQMTASAGGAAASGAFWTDMPTPTRVSDTQFTIVDTSNAAKYDLLFKKGTVLQWLESGTYQTAMVISSSYSSNAVTINIVGHSLTAGFTDMKYASQKAEVKEFVIPGNLNTGTDLARTWYTEAPGYIVSADAKHKTAGTTNATVYDINDNGTTLFTTKPSIASAATEDLDNVSDMAIVAANRAITIDIDSVSTTVPVDAYLKLFFIPESWRYRS